MRPEYDLRNWTIEADNKALTENMRNLGQKKQRIIKYMNTIAHNRIKWENKNSYYYNDMKAFFRYVIPNQKKVLEIGCGIGNLLAGLNPKEGVGIDISKEMVAIAKVRHKNLRFYCMDAENITLEDIFDYVIISDTIGYFEDVQLAISQLRKVCSPATRIIITFHNFLWQPILTLAQLLRIKMPTEKLNWLGVADIEGLLRLEDFEIVRNGSRLLCPKYIPLFSWFLNKFIAFLPFFRHFCLTTYIIAKQRILHGCDSRLSSVSVIIPARNEKGNIENAIKRLPLMGKYTEIIFVEGNSTDGTLEEIKRVCKKYESEIDIKYTVQEGSGKGDAVRRGFAMAKGDILMILDSDLTVPPEDLPKFYNAIVTGKGEFINGTRLVYPMEKEAMRFLNLLGNKFFSMVFTWLLDQRIKDTLCGTKVISRKNYEQLIENRSYFGDFDPFGDFDLIFGAAKLNLKFAEVPIKYCYREYGKTNISRFKHGLLLLKMTFYAMGKIKFVFKDKNMKKRY